jgi:hypothetical protein
MLAGEKQSPDLPVAPAKSSLAVDERRAHHVRYGSKFKPSVFMKLECPS